MKPHDSKISTLIEELRDVQAPPSLATDILRACREEEREAVRRPRLVIKGLVAGGVGLGTTALILALAAKPEMAFSQIQDLNRNHFNVVATMTDLGSTMKTEVSGNRYSVTEHFHDGSIETELEWDFDGNRQFSGFTTKFGKNAGERNNYQMGFTHGQKYGTIISSSRFQPYDVTSLKKSKGLFDPVASDPALFPFPDPHKADNEETFDGKVCDVYEGRPGKTRRVVEIASCKVYVEKETHRIVGKKLTTISNRDIVTHYEYPSELPESDFSPHPGWKVYDLDIIRKEIADKSNHPLTARTPRGAKVGLVCAARQANDDILVLWNGVPPNGSLDHPAEIIGNPRKSVYGTMAGTSTRVLLQKNMLHTWKGTFLAGHSIKPSKPVGSWVDLKVPHFHVDHRQPITNHGGKVLGYKSKFDGYAVFHHVPLMEIPMAMHVLE